MLKILSILILLCASWCQAADLAWNASVVDEQHAAPDGYRIHWGASPGIYTGQADAGNALTWHIPDDWSGQYYFVASAYNAWGQSGYSNEVLFTRDQPQQHIGATGLAASRYQAEINKMAEELRDSNTASSATMRQVGKYTNYLYSGGNFTAGSSYTLSSIDVYLNRSGTATGTLVAHIWGTSSGAPTGSPLASSNAVNRSTVPTSESPVNFAGFSLQLNSGTEYCVILQSSEVNGDETINIHFSANEDYTREQYNDANGVPPFSFDNLEAVKFRTYEDVASASAVPVIMRSYRARRN